MDQLDGVYGGAGRQSFLFDERQFVAKLLLSFLGLDGLERVTVLDLDEVTAQALAFPDEPQFAVRQTRHLADTPDTVTRSLRCTTPGKSILG